MFGKILGGFGDAADWLRDQVGGLSLDRTKNPWSQVDPGGRLGSLADQGAAGYRGTGAQLQGVANQLQQQALGNESLSAEQLRQSLGQALSQQRALAASAAPSNQAMAARQAAIQSARLSSGLAGQQAMAGIAERQAANQALGALLGGMRGQDLQAALGGYGTLEGARTGRFQGALSQPTTGERVLGGVKDAATIAMMSDRRLKTDIKDGSEDADEFLAGLKAYRYRYKDPKHGEGDQLGILAQDLEKTRLGKQAIIETPEGKAVHGAKLAGALAAAAVRLGERLSKLEQKGSR